MSVARSDTEKVKGAVISCRAGTIRSFNLIVTEKIRARVRFDRYNLPGMFGLQLNGQFIVICSFRTLDEAFDFL